MLRRLCSYPDSSRVNVIIGRLAIFRSEYLFFFDKKENRDWHKKQIYGIILIGATILREAGQGRNPAALSECELCALFIV